MNMTAGRKLIPALTFSVSRSLTVGSGVRVDIFARAAGQPLQGRASERRTTWLGWLSASGLAAGLCATTGGQSAQLLPPPLVAPSSHFIHPLRNGCREEASE
ncbi:UNVERIFIED_CONTAM: hypothetical protein K2H54_051609 [Gekko kuhli]